MQQAPEDPQKRQEALERIQHLLNSPDGEMLVDELEAVWEPYTLLGETPEKTAHKVGLRDAFHFILALKNGELVDE